VITAVPFNINTASLAQLREGRALVMSVLEAHNLDKERSLDRGQLERLRDQKRAIEQAGRTRFDVRAWA
jgi:hypothetical protein